MNAYVIWQSRWWLWDYHNLFYYLNSNPSLSQCKITVSTTCWKTILTVCDQFCTFYIYCSCCVCWWQFFSYLYSFSCLHYIGSNYMRTPHIWLETYQSLCLHWFIDCFNCLYPTHESSTVFSLKQVLALIVCGHAEDIFPLLGIITSKLHHAELERNVLILKIIGRL